MPVNKIHKAVFVEGGFYHVYNRSVFGQKLFYCDKHYRYFLRQFNLFLSGVLRIYSWVLIPNHFHFEVSIKYLSECNLTDKEKMQLQNSKGDINPIIVNRFKNFFISYSLSLKKDRNIPTNVFASRFKHIRINSARYFASLMFYIHSNPAHHNMRGHWQSYKWSSYQRILSEVVSNLEVKYVLKWFGGKNAFIKFHEMQARRVKKPPE